MSALTRMREALKGLFQGPRQDAELRDEMQFHLEREVAKRVRAGASPGGARREALLAFGGTVRYTEEVRDARGSRPVEELLADIRYAIRGLRRNIGFTATAILVLGLGIGATTAVFSVVYTVLVAGLPYPKPDQLVVVVEKNSPTNIWNISNADATAIRAEQRAFAAFGTLGRGQAELTGTASPERIAVGRVTAGVFGALQVQPALGRLIQQGDEAENAPAVTVISHALALRLFASPEQAMGKSLTLDGTSTEVVGVLAPDRTDLAGFPASAWMVLKLKPPTRRGPFPYRGIGRLKPGVTVDAAARDLAGVSRRQMGAWGDFKDSVARLTPIPLREMIVGGAGTRVKVFAGAVLLVLLLAITNVATLVLVRASAREPEISMRVMLGAGRGRIARLLITENVVLTLAAGAVGIALAAFGIRLAATQLPNLPRINEVALDWRAVTFAIGVALVAGILVSLSPMATLARGAERSLRSENRRTGTSRSANRLRGALVMAEFALALPLLVGAGLLLNSFVRLQRVSPGFDPTGVVAVGVALPAARYPGAPELTRFWQLAVQRASEIPGVVAVGVTTNLPPDNSGGNNNFNLVDHPVPTGQAEPTAPWYNVTPGYFSALGVKLLEGRMFLEADSNDTGVIVSRAWARRFFPGEDAVGRQLISGGCYTCPRTTIVGVAADIKSLGLAGSEAVVYSPMDPGAARFMSLLVRSGSNSTVTLRALRETISSIDPQLPVAESEISERFRASLDEPKRWTAVLGSFAAAGALLAALGVFGLMSYVVRQRRREIGVRLALGAAPSSVSRLIIARGMRYAFIGSAIGLVITLVAAQRIESLLFGVGSRDLMTIAAVSALLLVVALVSCWIPGWRAARVRPLEAIGAE